MSGAAEYARAKELFLEASRLPPGDRTRFLHAKCGADATLEGCVRRLLALDQQEDEFLAGPALAYPGSSVDPGTRLGHFRIVHLLGEGGMGVVYEAHQDEPDRRVALKLIRHGNFSERLRARFRHEIRVLGHLRHPGVAQIYEAGTLAHAGEHIPYFAMELVEGEPLLQYASRLGMRDRLALVAQICDAVHHAHQKGVIHRDLKPGNIMVEAAPSTGATMESGTVVPFQVKILDFGVARAIDHDSAAPSVHTQAGQLIGTLPYMSPEQAAGDTDAIDTRSDVYSIGVIACQVLIGRLPYEVEGKLLPEAARIIRDQEAVRLSAIDRSLRGDVETIVAKALQKDRRMRYQSAAELAADVRRYLRDEPIVARPASAIYHLRKFARRHKTLVAAAALVVVTMGAGTAVSMWQAGRAGRALATAERERERASIAAASATREANRATLAGAAAAIASGDPITASRLLEGAHERGWAWRFWHARLDESVASVTLPAQIAAAWMSPDGRDSAVVCVDGTVHRGSLWSGALKESARLAETPLRFAAFFDDGRRLITDGADRRVLTVFDAADGRVLDRYKPIDAPLGLLEVSDDGRTILAGPRRPGRSPADVLYLFRRDDAGAWTENRVSIPRGTSCAAMTPDGRWLALGKGNEGVMTWNTAESEPRELVPLARGAEAVAISSDATRIATGGVGKIISIWDRATGKLVRTLAGHTRAITALAFDPAGATLASAGDDLTIRLWDTSTGQPIATFIGHSATIERLQFCPDGILLSASKDRTIRIWRRDPYEKACVLRGHSSYVYAVAFPPDGARILSAAWDGKVCAWDAASGQLIGETSVDPGWVTALGVSPDGRTVVTGRAAGGSPATPDFKVELRDAVSLALVRELAREKGEVSDLVFSADGTRLYAAWDARGVDEFDLSTTPPTRRRLIVEGAPRSLALSPDGRRIACGHTDGSISIVDAATGALVRRLEGHRARAWVRGLAFHPALPLLASACDDGTARLWDLETGRAVVLRGHTDKVYCVAFSPDGAILATGSEDTTIALWDTREGAPSDGVEELTRLRGHDAYVYSLAFSPDGSRLVSGSGDHTVRVWDTRPLHERTRPP
jgi:WD40 repeat protein/serine/threonine protein kinase